MRQISVELLDYMGGDLSVVNAARVSFNKFKEEFDEKDVGLIHYLAREQHSSPFRHNQLQLRCKVPLFLARQLQKHQAGLSWNEVSRRYVSDGIEFFVPDSWRRRPDDGIKQGSGEGEVTHITLYGAEEAWTSEIGDAYQSHFSQSLSLYESMVESGVAPEMARMVLPQSMMIDWVWTGNLLSFFHVYRLRSGGGAQQEAKDFAEKLKQVVQPIFPHSWKALEENAKTH